MFATLKHKWETTPFYPKIFRLVLPIIIQNLLSAAVSSADIVMLNFLGEDAQSAISAVSLATQYSNVLFSVYFGLGTGVTMLCAQYYGKEDFSAIRVIQGIALRISLIITILLAGFSLLFPEVLMGIFTTDSDLITVGAGYLRVISIAYLCWGISEVYLASLRSIGKVAISTGLNMMAFGLNILLNAVFIFGLFGAPQLGATGVALATSLSRLVELMGCFMVSAFQKEIKLQLRMIFVRNKLLFKDFVRMSLPALANDVIWGLAFSTYSVIIGHLGSDAVAANAFVIVARNFGTILCYGMASAGSILLGNEIGENKLEEARRDAGRLMKLTLISSVIGGLIILAATPFILTYADISDTAKHYLKYMLLINTYYVTGTAVNTTLIAGVFRAGGDSRFGFFCDTIDMWFYAVPLGFIAAFILDLPVLVVYFLLCTDEFVKWPWVLKHYKSGKWLKNITRDNLFEETNPPAQAAN